MALTKELLKKSAQLEGLSDEQIAAIVELSRNDEDTVVGGKYRDLLNDLDASIKEVSGVEKTTNEKTSTYLKRVLGEQKSSVDALTTEKNTLTSKVTELEGQIAKGAGNEELLRQKEATIADMQKQYNTLKGEKEQMENDHKAAMLNYRIDTELNAAMGSIAFKADANPEIVNVLKKQVMEAMKAERKPSYITDAGGNEILVFHNADGSEARNQNNGLNLYTAKELLTEGLAKFNIVDDGKPAGGAGGSGSTPKPKTSVTGAKTKAEFMEIAENIAHSKGLTRGTAEFDDEKVRIMEENQAVYDALPYN